MHIALITHYFPPEVNAPAQRAIDHALKWIESGHQVTIVTAVPSHPYGKPYEGYINATTEEFIDGIRIIRVRTLLSANAGTFGRMKNYLSFPFSVRSNINQITGVDVVISTSPQFFCGLSGYFVKKAFGVPWILEIRDVWPDSIVAVGAAKPSVATNFIGKLAKWAYNSADAIVSVSPGFAEHFTDYGVAASKITLIPNGINTEVTPSSVQIDNFVELSTLNGRTIVAFIGTLGMAHGLQTILDTAKLLESDSRIGFLLVGSGAQSDTLKLVVQENGHLNVVIMDQLPRDQILKLWSLVSLSIVHLKKNPVFETVIPTKLLESMAMQKPVVLGVQGTAANILNSAKGGIAVEPENPKALADAITRFVDDPEHAERVGKQGRSYVVQNFDRQVMAKRYLTLMESLTSGNNAEASRHRI